MYKSEFITDRLIIREYNKTDIKDFLRASAAAIEMDDTNGFGAWSDGCFDETVVNLQRLSLRLNEHRFETILRDC